MPAETLPNRLIAKVSACLTDPTRPFGLLVNFQAKEGAGPAIEAAFAKAIKATRLEKGCLVYDLNRDASMPARYVVYERWQNLAALESHVQSPHIATLQQEINDLRIAPAEAQVFLPAGE